MLAATAHHEGLEEIFASFACIAMGSVTAKTSAVNNRLRRTLSRKSAGLLLFRETPDGVEVLLVHPGGPYWARKDDGAWSIPKGELAVDEEPLAAARRECEEEMGCAVDGDFLPLEPLKQPSGKVVLAWAVRSDFDPSALRSNAFSMEWPPRSGRHQQFPEVDRAEWFDMESAKRKILKGQAPFLEQLLTRMKDRGRTILVEDSAQTRVEEGP